MLSPIRIQVKDVEGVLFTKKAEEIVATYYDSNRDYRTSESTAIRLSNRWDDAGKVGYEEINLNDLINEGEADENIYDNIVFDKNIDNYSDLDIQIKQKLNTTEKINSITTLLNNKDLFRDLAQDNFTTDKEYEINTDISNEDKLSLGKIHKIKFENETLKINMNDLMLYDWYINLDDKLIDHILSLNIINKKNY